jgi:anaerobic magnesium-protoporphyrin IX monomethyl ester cyclase
MDWLGAETGSQKILDAMNKAQTVEQIKEARWVLKGHGIQTGLFVQFGYLGEEKEDIDNTIDMLMELMPEDIGVSISYPLPGTVFHQQVKDQLKEKANWTDSDDLALMYEGSFSPNYYRRLHRHVHRRFRKKQRVNKIRSVITGRGKFSKRLFRDMVAIGYYIPAIWWDRVMLARLIQETGDPPRSPD